MSAQTDKSGLRWPHRLAVVLAWITFPLIWVGGLVTTYDAGMSVPDWPGTYGYNLFLYPLSTWISGPWDLFIEHGHRLLGAAAGMVTIAVALAVWRCDRRKWARWAAAATVLLVLLQGVLGGMRVVLDSTTLARWHGCTGPLFYAAVIGMCVVTSQRWHREPSRKQAAPGTRLAAWAWVTVGLVYLQLVLGAHLRHPGVNWGPGEFRALTVLHLVTAALLVLQAVSLGWNLCRPGRPAGFFAPALMLLLLVCAQVGLGLATWTVKFGWPAWLPGRPQLTTYTIQAESMTQSLTITGHAACGSLILASSVWLALHLTRAAYRQHVATGQVAPAVTHGVAA
jgi:cytochrome c oxidase assembly protein subunit 15